MDDRVDLFAMKNFSLTRAGITQVGMMDGDLVPAPAMLSCLIWDRKVVEVVQTRDHVLHSTAHDQMRANESSAAGNENLHRRDRKEEAEPGQGGEHPMAVKIATREVQSTIRFAHTMK